MGAELRQVFGAAERERLGSPQNLTLRELAAQAGGGDPPALHPGRGGESGAGGQLALDEK
jgi:hypothetical protein